MTYFYSTGLVGQGKILCNSGNSALSSTGSCAVNVYNTNSISYNFPKAENKEMYVFSLCLHACFVISIYIVYGDDKCFG